MFGSKMDPELKQFREEVQTLIKKLETEDLAERISMSDELVDLKKQVTNLEIERDKKQEDFDRQKREIEHKIGLERKRSEFEREQAIAQAKIEVKEQNLGHEKERFEQEMKFMRDRMEHEVDQLNTLLGKVMEMVPRVDVSRNITEEYSNQPKALDKPKDE